MKMNRYPKCQLFTGHEPGVCYTVLVDQSSTVRRGVGPVRTTVKVVAFIIWSCMCIGTPFTQSDSPIVSLCTHYTHKKEDRAMTNVQ